MRQLVLATHNRHKAEEFQALLKDLDVEVLSLDGFPQVGDIVEDADTLEGNALKKAREVFRKTGLTSLADDTGLEVYYLNGEPGVYSSRYSGLNATYADNCRKLLSRLNGVPARRRGARFRTVLAVVGSRQPEVIALGSCAGEIIESPRGSSGFGYDPIFLPAGHDQTFAEMDAGTKNALSHRGKAIEALKPLLREYLLKLP